MQLSMKKKTNHHHTKLSNFSNKIIRKFILLLEKWKILLQILSFLGFVYRNTGCARGHGPFFCTAFAFGPNSIFWLPDLLVCGSSKHTEKRYMVHGPGLSAGRTVRNDKNGNKFAFTANLCCNKFVLYPCTKMCMDPLYKPLGRNLCAKVTLSFPSMHWKNALKT